MNPRTLGLVIAGVTVLSVLAYAFSLLGGGAATANMTAYGEVLALGDGTPVLTAIDVAAHLDQYDGQTVRIEGQISQVCQMKGCWLMLRNVDGGADIRINVPRQDGDYVYTFAKDIPAGTRAILEGRVARDTLSVELLRHFAEDAGKSASEIEAITAPQVAVVMTATGALVAKDA